MKLNNGWMNMSKDFLFTRMDLINSFFRGKQARSDAGLFFITGVPG